MSRLYVGFRALGLVTNDVPFSIQARGSTHFLTSCIEKSFQIYHLEKMQLLFVGDSNAIITALKSFKDFTFCAIDSGIQVFIRSTLETTLTHDSTFEITKLDILGDLLLATCTDNCIRIWTISTRKFHSLISFPFQISFMIHPSTYLNKILIASSTGIMQLWNINTMKCIHEFKKFNPITCLEQTPVIDVVAISTSKGEIIIYNIRLDIEIMKFNQNEQITSISFRTDGSSIMVTGDVLGNIMVWDLEIKSMVKFFKGHEGSVIELCFLNGTNVLVSNGADNSIKQWVFDDEPRLLRFRSGHNASPTMMKFKGDKGRDILSVGGDCSLRMFSVIRDQQNVEFSQGKSERVTQVLDFDSNFLKERDWDNVITCHSKSNQAKTWNFSRKAIGKHTFTSTDNSFIKSVAISHCGNFGFIGSSNGVIDMFNMQSGLFRKSFVGHSKSITGLFTNEMSSKLFSTSLDGTFIIWDIQTSTSTIINLNSPISLSIANNDKSLIAITTDNLEIKVFDTTSLSLIRKFNGHRNRILSLCFSNDSRWIVSTSLDSTIRTWDLPTSSLIDCFKTDSIATSIAFSCTGEFLVTSHVGKLGLFLWSNKTLFTHVSIKVVDDSCVLGVGLPSAGTRQEDEPETNAFDTFPHVIVAEEMICLSTQPRSKWQNLLNINSIKKRNKPIGKVIEAPDAPFFLPTISGTVPKFKLDDVNESDSRIVKMMDLDVITEFIRLLRQGNSNGDCIYN